MSALLGLATTASALLPVDKAEAFLFGRNEYKVSKTKLVMGTYVAITAIHSSKDQANEAIELAFEEINRLNGLMSRHLATTPLAELNRTGKLSQAPPELLQLVQQSIFLHNDTASAFDITVLPLVNLYATSFSAGEMPTDSEIDTALGLVGVPDIHVKGSEITLARSGMGITLDGIAKGYIVDKASKILLAHGVENHLINAGGDIKTSGNAIKGKPWKIAVQDPAKGGDYPEIVHMNTGAIATSGNYEIFYDKEKLFHHIVNPTTGRSPHLSKSVTIEASTVMEADALATAVFVMEPLKGVPYINSRPGVECFIIDKDDGVHKSQGWST